LFPQLTFLLTDRNPACLNLVEERAKSAGITNVHTLQFSLGESSESISALCEKIRNFQFSSQTPDSKSESSTSPSSSFPNSKTESSASTFPSPSSFPNSKSDISPSASSSLPNSKSESSSHAKGERLFGLGFGLHCCGSFTDSVVEVCYAGKADCIVCPCCNGKMGQRQLPSEKLLCTPVEEEEQEDSAKPPIDQQKRQPLEQHGATHQPLKGAEAVVPTIDQQEQHVVYPRSPFLREQIGHREYVGLLCPAADNLRNRQAKMLIEFDRALYSRRLYKKVDLLSLAPLSCTPKNLVIRMQGAVLDE